MTILELREKRAKAWESAKAFLDSHRTSDGTLSVEDDANMIADGADEFIEVGPGKVLQGLVAKINREVATSGHQ